MDDSLCASLQEGLQVNKSLSSLRYVHAILSSVDVMH